jgi:hypothetical protein
MNPSTTPYLNAPHDTYHSTNSTPVSYPWTPSIYSLIPQSNPNIPVFNSSSQLTSSGTIRTFSLFCL